MRDPVRPHLRTSDHAPKRLRSILSQFSSEGMWGMLSRCDAG
jgi:hypothetical protein